MAGSIQWQVGGRALLVTPAGSDVALGPCLFRAPTDNDRGGVKGQSYASRWTTAGLDRLAPLPGGTLQAVMVGDTAEVRAAWTLAPAAGEGLAGEQEAAGVGEVGGAHWLALKEESKPAEERASAMEDGQG